MGLSMGGQVGKAWDGAAVTVAASNSPVYLRRSAKYKCDGTADNVQIQAAIDELTAGGSVALTAGTYSFTGSVTVTVNKLIHIVGYGARVNLATGVTGFKVAQGIFNAVGVVIEGVDIRGGNNATTVGVEFEDTNNSVLRKCNIEDCAIGILFDSDTAGNFVEGSLLDDVVMRNCVIGWDFTVGSGTGSFAQTIASGLRIVVGTNGTGIRCHASGILQRVLIDSTIFLGTNETAISIDGNVEDARINLAIEGAAGSTGNIGVLVDNATTNADTMDLRLMFTGTVNTQISGSKALHYSPGGPILIQTAGTVFWGYKRHGDATERVRLELVAAGPKLSFGDGASALDVTLYRSAANVLKTDDSLTVGALFKGSQTATAADPTTTEYPADQDWGIHKNTSSGAVFLAYNDGGSTIKKVALV